MDDETIISLAIERSRRGRWRTLLSNPKKRQRLLDKLNHRPPLDSRYTVWYSSFAKALADINTDPSAEVYVLMADSDLDGKTMSFAEAIDQVPRSGCGALIAISPNLAVYYGEMNERAAIIKRTV